MATPTCHWCESTRLEPRDTGDDLKRMRVCLTCGAIMRSTIVVTTQALLGLVDQNKKITAIKLHRIKTGIGLKEAKLFVEELSKYK